MVALSVGSALIQGPEATEHLAEDRKLPTHHHPPVGCSPCSLWLNAPAEWIAWNLQFLLSGRGGGDATPAVLIPRQVAQATTRGRDANGQELIKAVESALINYMHGHVPFVTDVSNCETDV
jgi:hypothetical protein